MADFKPTWTENITSVDFDDTTPADGVTATASIDLAAAGYDKVKVMIKIDWHASATDYADISVKSDVNSGSLPATTPDFSFRVTALDNDPEYIAFTVQDTPYVDIEVDNQSNQEIAELDIVYAGRYWSSS